MLGHNQEPSFPFIREPNGRICRRIFPLPPPPLEPSTQKTTTTTTQLPFPFHSKQQDEVQDGWFLPPSIPVDELISVESEHDGFRPMEWFPIHPQSYSYYLGHNLLVSAQKLADEQRAAADLAFSATPLEYITPESSSRAIPSPCDPLTCPFANLHLLAEVAERASVATTNEGEDDVAH